MSKGKGIRFLSILLSVQCALLALPPIYGRNDPPRLVVVLVVDGLGQGQLLKLRDRLKPDGSAAFWTAAPGFPRAATAMRLP